MKMLVSAAGSNATASNATHTANVPLAKFDQPGDPASQLLLTKAETGNKST